MRGITRRGRKLFEAADINCHTAQCALETSTDKADEDMTGIVGVAYDVSLKIVSLDYRNRLEKATLLRYQRCFCQSNLWTYLVTHSVNIGRYRGLGSILTGSFHSVYENAGIEVSV